MKTPFLCIATNTHTSLVFSDKNNVLDFAAMVADQLSDLLNVISTTDADEGFVKGAMATAIDLSFQLEQVTGALRDGPDGHQDADWLPQTRPAEVHPDAADNFMQGKALAALLILSTAGRKDGDSSALPSSYRDDHVYRDQDNYSRDIIEKIAANPEWIEGFSAALTHHLSVNTPTEDAADNASWTAKLSYEACRTLFGDHQDKDPYTAPPLPQQLDAIDIAPPTPPASPPPAARKAHRRGKAVTA